MIAPKENVAAFFTLYKNLPFKQRLLHQGIDGMAVDLTGAAGKLSIRKSLSATDPILHTFEGVDVVCGNGFIELNIPLAATINAFVWEQGVGHLVVTPLAGSPRVIALFGFNVRMSTTVMP